MCRACLQIHRQVPVRPLRPPGRCPPTKLESLSWCDARVYVVPERFAVEPRTNFQARIAHSSADRVWCLGTPTFCQPLAPRLPTCRPFKTAFEQLVPTRA